MATTAGAPSTTLSALFEQQRPELLEKVKKANLLEEATRVVAGFLEELSGVYRQTLDQKDSRTAAGHCLKLLGNSLTGTAAATRTLLLHRSAPGRGFAAWVGAALQVVLYLATILVLTLSISTPGIFAIVLLLMLGAVSFRFSSAGEYLWGRSRPAPQTGEPEAFLAVDAEALVALVLDGLSAIELVIVACERGRGEGVVVVPQGQGLPQSLLVCVQNLLGAALVGKADRMGYIVANMLEPSLRDAGVEVSREIADSGDEHMIQREFEVVPGDPAAGQEYRVVLPALRYDGKVYKGRVQRPAR
jgi:hypothetical protein